MKRQAAYPLTTLRFRKWSRKGYAAFLSLKRTVTIGCLKTDICEQAQSKNRTLHTAYTVTSTEGTEEEEATNYLPSSREAATRWMLAMDYRLPVTTQKQAAPAQAGSFSCCFPVYRHFPMSGKCPVNNRMLSVFFVHKYTS